MKIKFLIPALLLSGLFALSAPASAAVVDFEDSGNADANSVGSPFSDQGLVFSSLGSQYTLNGSVSTPPGVNNGSKFLINGWTTTTVTATNHSPFSLNSLDLGLSYYAPESEAVTLTGNFASGGSSSVSFLLNNSVFQTFGLEGFNNLASFTLSALSEFGYLAIDNIHYNENASSQVPEPATIALLGLGLLGFAASRRKSVKKQ